MYKDAVIAARDVDTVRTKSYSGKPMRVKDNAWVKDWESRPGDIQPFPMQAMTSMQANAMGGIGGQTEGLDADRSCFAMGQSAGGVKSIATCKEIVDGIMAEAVEAIGRVGRLVS